MRIRAGLGAMPIVAVAACSILLALSVAGCGLFSGPVEDGRPEELVGNWRAKGYHGSYYLTLKPDGSYTEVLSGWPGLGASTVEGQWVVEDGRLVLYPAVSAVPN